MSLAGKTVAFTGEMVGMTRKQAAQVAQAAGAMVGSATSKNIDFLFAGSGATPAKTMKAQQNGIAVLAAPQFTQMTNGIPVPAAAPAMPVATPAPAMPVAATPAPVAYPANVVTKAPRGRRPRSAMPVAAAPMMQQPVMQQPVAQQFAQPMQFHPYVAATQPVFDNAPVMLPGKKVCFTGSFECGNRAQIGEFAEREGAMVHAHILADTDMLVCGIAAHETKLAAAKQMGVRCVTEQQFVAAMRAPAPVAAAPAYAMPAATPAMPMAAPKMRKPRTIAAPLPPAPVNAAPIMLAGQNVCFTGALQVNRVVAATMVTKAGGFPQSALSAKTNLLVCGANASGKVAKAQAMGIRCCTEAEFVAACRM